MSDSLPIAQIFSLREAGHDEAWLQQRIFENPSCLGLGDLTALDKERRQGSGGRIDILLKDDEDDAMYEVEIMLGETDETHIIRTIEYWDNEKRRWPQRQHFAVLVAENFNRRFFNVIYLLSQSIPLIAVRASLLQMGGQKFLFFAKIIDTYEEVDDGVPIEPPADRSFWVSRSQITLAIAEDLLQVVKGVDPTALVSFTKSYVAIGSKKNYIWVTTRKGNKARVEIRISDVYKDAAQKIFDEKSISADLRRGTFRFALQREQISTYATMIAELAKMASE